MKRFTLPIIMLALLAGVLWLWQTARPVKERKISGAYKALNLWSEQRAYPNASIPDVAHYAAYEFSKTHLSEAVDNTESVDAWEEIGPHNLGGRTLALAFNPQNPNTIFAGSASGGLWKSYSGGRGVDAWEYVPTGFPILAVSSIAFAPGDSNIIYIGTGEVYNYQFAGTGAAYRSTRGTYGIGILKSTDGGLSWSKSLDWSYHQQRGVWAVKINPLNPNTIWAATTEGTYKSLDAGQSWSQVHNVVMGTDLVINPVDTNVVVTAYGNFGSSGYGIYRTADGGNSWVQASFGLPSQFNGKIQLHIYEADPTIVYASIGNGFGFNDGASWLCRSNNGGLAWGVVNTLDYSQHQGWYSHDVAVNPANPDELFAIGIHVYKSTNGGSTLTQVSNGNAFSGRILPGDPEGTPAYSHPDHHDVIYHPSDPNIIYFANDGGVTRTTDGGVTFENCNGGYQTGQFYNGFVSAQTDSLLAIGGLQDNSTAVYDGQLAWFIRLIGGDGGWAAIDPSNPDHMFGSWQGLNVLKSTNRGSSFFNVPVPNITGGPTLFIAPYVIAENDPQVMYAGRDLVYKSTNGGVNWEATGGGTPLNGGAILALGVSPLNSSVVYAATAPFPGSLPRGVFRSLNGGVSWNNVSGSLPDRFPTDFAVDPLDAGTVYLTFSGFGSPHIFKSTDFGGNWSDISSGLPDIPFNAIVIDPYYPDYIYAGSDIGVYVSEDAGVTWNAFSEGLPDAVIAMSLSISPLNRKLRVATHGNGAYQRPLLEPPAAIADADPVVTQGFSLEQNYPNPFNPATTIRYALNKALPVTLQIFNARGQLMRTLVNREVQHPGEFSVQWDGRDRSGSKAASGVYIYRLTAGGQVAVRQMVLVK